MLSAFFSAISGRKQRVPTRLQYQTTECGVAALAMILAHHGRYETMEGVRRVTGVSRDCVNAGDMVRAARHYGLVSKAFSREPDALADLPLPFLAHLRFIHFVVVEGFSDDYVLINDPAVGRSRVPREKFADDFTGVALTFKPGPDFVPQGNNPNLLLGFWQRLTVAAKRNLAAVVLARSVAATLMVGFAWAFGAWFDALFAPGGDPAAPGAASLSVSVLLLALANALVLAGERHTTDQLFQRMAVDQARGLAHHMVALPNRFFAYRLPDKLRATLYAGAAVASLLCQRLLPDVLGIVSMGTAWIALVYLEPGLAALLAAVVLALGVAAALIYWRAGDWLRLRHSATAGSAGAMFMEPEELERSKFAGRDQDFVNARLSASAALQKSRQEGGVVAAVLRGLASGAVLLGVSLALVYVNGLVVSGEVGMGTAFTLLVLTLMVTAPLAGITRTFHEVDMLWHELLPVDDVLACMAGEEGGAAPLVADLPNNLVLRAHQLVFGYSPNRAPQIAGIDIELRRGEQLGLTGPSGGGKSTLAGVLAGQHRCTSGALTYAASTTVAWVDKGSFFFEGTVRDNLCLWQESISPDAIQRAVQDACLDDVLQARPGGLDARVEQRGRNFSGGQRQRMEIARALLREPRILILDEATDGLDPALELRIRANIRNRGCALIMVSHRASTLAACDRVLRVAAGKLESFDPLQQANADASDAQVPAGPPVAVPLEASIALDPRLLAAAVGRVAVALGVPTQATVPAAGDSPQDILALARLHHLHARKVRFTVGAWRRRSHGPLVVVRRADRKPLVVLGQGPSRCCVDPGSGERFAFDSSLAIEQEAWCFYPRAPQAPLRTWPMLMALALATWPAFAVAGGISLLLGVLWLALPMGALQLFSGTQGHPLQWGVAGLGVLALALAVGCMEVAVSVAALRAGGHVELSAMARFAQRAAQLVPSFARSMAVDDLQRTLASLQQLLNRLQGLAVRQIFDAAMLVVPLGFLLTLDWRMAVLALLLAAVGMLAPLALSRRARQDEKASDKAELASRRFLLDVWWGGSRLRALGMLNRALDRWQAMHTQDAARASKVRAMDASAEGWRHSGRWVAMALMVGAASLWPPASAGHLAAMLLAVWFMLDAALSLGQGLLAFRRADLHAPLADELGLAPIEPHAPDAPREARRIALVNASFCYPGSVAPAVDNVSLAIEPGEFVAITGGSGSGKSTLLRLLLGLDVPSTGQVQLGDPGQQSHAMAPWRRWVGMVTQEERLLSSSTLRSQISGLADGGVAEVWAAATTTLLADDIRRMPMGLQTIVESGKISTGQEQRLLIARELVRQPVLLVLDEATNAVPDALQAALFANLRKLGLTCVLVTHRETAIAQMDRVLVMEGGRIAWSGTPQALAGQPQWRAVLSTETQVGTQ